MLDRHEDQLFFRLCSDHLSVEAIPKRRLRVDFAGIKQNLEGKYRVLMWTPYFVVLGIISGAEEITLRRDGRMIIRKAVSDEKARFEAVRLLRLLDVIK
jgi:hypothetical protein